jgi:Rhodopirellula transposase DDE domain
MLARQSSTLLVGRFKNGGKEWHPAGKPEEVNVHDFADKELGRAAPYGVYDIAADQGWVSVGTDHDTAAFAVQTIRRWWFMMGKPRYPKAKELTITADGGGSNGHRVRLWKLELSKLARETGLTIHVCHFPPGTSKWNKIEHRLFSFITMNWRARPLISHEVIVNLIASTKTSTGLLVHAELDTNDYPKGVAVSDEEMAGIRLEPDEFHGDWNYRIKPQ